MRRKGGTHFSTFDPLFLFASFLTQEQDKVNYAVSEREDRVTGVTTLTRMTGCIGMYWAVLGCTGLFWAVWGCTELYWDVLGCTGLCWTVLGCIWLYWAVQGCTGLYWAELG